MSTVQAHSPRVLHSRVSPFLRHYYQQREARNSAKSSKPAFFNIDRELRLTKERDQAFRRDMEKAVERLGDMTVFEKYRGRRREERRGIGEGVRGRKEEKKGRSRALSLELRGKVVWGGKELAEFPISTKTYYDCSTREKSTPMHQDPHFHFHINRSHKPSPSLTQTLTLELDQVLSRCTGLESTCAAAKHAAVSTAQTALQSALSRFERVTDMVESLQTADLSSSFYANLQRIKAEKGINRRLLDSAGEVRKSYLDSSEFVSKCKQKEIWRVPTLALTRHTDRLLNSLPTSLSPK